MRGGTEKNIVKLLRPGEKGKISDMIRGRDNAPGSEWEKKCLRG